MGVSEIYRCLFAQQLLQQGLRVVCQLGGVLKHTGAEQGGVDQLPCQQRGKLFILRLQLSQFLHDGAVRVEGNLGVILGHGLTHGLEVGAHLRGDIIFPLQGNGGGGGDAVADGDFTESVCKGGRNPSGELVALLLVQPGLVGLTLQRGELQVGAVNGLDFFIFYLVDAVYHKLVTTVGEEAHLKAAGFESIQIGAVLQLGAGGTVEHVDVLLVLFHAGDIICKRGKFAGLGKGGLKTQQLGEGILMLPRGYNALFDEAAELQPELLVFVCIIFGTS